MTHKQKQKLFCLDTIKEFAINPKLRHYVPGWVGLAKYYGATEAEIERVKEKIEFALARAA